VFFGWEETFDGDDYLVYGPDREWLLEHPEARDWSRRKQYRLVKEAGGCVIHAHPFRQHYYIQTIYLAPDLIDAVEAANAGNHEQHYDALAMRYAARLSLPVTAGSDIHHIKQAEDGNLYGMYVNKKLESPADFVAAIKNPSALQLKTEKGRFESRENEPIDIPLEILDKNERPISQDFWGFLEQP
jgi:hypothetical protein